MDALAIYQRRTGDIPPALRNRPEDPSPEAEFYLHAFYFLSGFRGSNGFGMNPLSYEAAADYAERVGCFRAEEFFPFMEAMRALDQVYLTHAHEKQNREAKTTAPRGRKRRN